MAIDYGTKRVGLAVTDPSGIIATALCTLGVHEVLPFLKDYVAREAVERIVVGEPKQLNNTPSEIAPAVNKFVAQLNKHFPELPVDRVDERFTSSMAAKSMLEAGYKKKDRRKKELVDQVSAVIILQSWMAQKSS
jgi:putative Holliday junction resolvase